MAFHLQQVADPEDACQPFTFKDTAETWVALISRSQQLHLTNCTFDVKVRCMPCKVVYGAISAAKGMVAV